MLKKCFYAFVLGFLLTFILVSPRVYAYELTETDYSLIDSIYQHFNISYVDFPNVIYNNSSSKRISVCGSYSFLYVENGWFVLHVDNVFSYSFSGNSYSDFVNQYISYPISNVLLNFDISNSSLTINKSFDYPLTPPTPLEVADELGTYPSISSVLNYDDNYLLYYLPNEEMRKYRLLVTNNRYKMRKGLLTNNELVLKNTKSNTILKVYKTSDDGQSWVLDDTINNFDDFQIVSTFNYNDSIQVFNALNNINSNVVFIDFDNSHSSGGFAQDLPDRFNLEYTWEGPIPWVFPIGKDIYKNSAEVPTGSNDPITDIIVGSALDFIPSELQGYVDTNTYPYVVMVNDFESSGYYRIVQSELPLRLIRKKTLVQFAIDNNLSNNWNNNPSYLCITRPTTRCKVYVALYRIIDDTATKVNDITYNLKSYNYYSGDLVVYSFLNQGYKSNYNLYACRIDDTNGDFVDSNEIINAYNDIGNSGSSDIAEDDKNLLNVFFNTFGEKLKQWFVPTQEHNQIVNQFTLKIGFLDSFKELYNNLISISTGSLYNELPTLNIDFTDSNNSIYSSLGSISVLDLSFITPKMSDMIKRFTSVILSLTFLFYLGSQIPNILSGVTQGMNLQNISQANKSTERIKTYTSLDFAIRNKNLRK